MAVLSRAGCNQGTCHGNQNGKNGFKLSLRGQDPAFDYLALTRDQRGRRLNLYAPDQSLLLKKATAQVAHEGGRRLRPATHEYQLLRDWVAAGAPRDRPGLPALVALEVDAPLRIVVAPRLDVQIKVVARFADGTRTSVQDLAVFEASPPNVQVSPTGLIQGVGPLETTILVRYLDQQVPVPLAFVPARPEFVWPHPPVVNEIDRLVFARLQELKIAPAGLVADEVFVRRLFLDVLGILPTAEETRAFLRDHRADKRARLIDAVLERPEFVDRWALKWADLLRAEEKTLDRKGVQALHQWLKQAVAEDRPLPDLARDLVAGLGSTYENPPANFYRALREPIARSETVAQVFLGLRLQCAKCHNHPFDRWTQDDYYNWASFFSRVDYLILENRRKDRNDLHEFDGEQVVFLKANGSVLNPRTGLPAVPRFLGQPTPNLDPDDNPLERLANWIAAPDNPFFARMQANRLWAQVMGHGIVDPIDDFRATNLPVNEPLLEWLARDFVAHGSRPKHTLRTILNSRTYQLASAPARGTEATDPQATALAERNFAQAQVRRLDAEQVLDAFSQVTRVPVAFNGYPLGIRAGQLPGVEAVRKREQPPSQGDLFLRAFGKPPRLISCDCERTPTTTLSQIFHLISGPLQTKLLTEPDNRIGDYLRANRTPDEILDDLFLTSITRLPTAAERAHFRNYVLQASDRRRAWEDVTWVLINAKEFMLRH